MMVFLIAKHDGNANAARQEFGEVFQDRLAPGQKLPSANCFRRNAHKFFDHHTITDLVNLERTSQYLNVKPEKSLICHWK